MNEIMKCLSQEGREIDAALGDETVGSFQIHES